MGYLASDRCYPFTELELCTPGHQTNGQPMGLKYVRPLTEAQWREGLQERITTLCPPKSPGALWPAPIARPATDTSVEPWSPKTPGGRRLPQVQPSSLALIAVSVGL